MTKTDLSYSVWTGQNHFRTMSNFETVPDFLFNAANWVRRAPRLRRLIRYNSQDNRICWTHEELEAYGRNLEV